MKKRWLETVTWGIVEETNRLLCIPNKAFHGSTRDGHGPTKSLWSAHYRNEMHLIEAIELCRRCHRLAPFCNYNGNTFTAIMRQQLATIQLPSDQIALLRSLAGHVIAGVATPEEEADLRKTIQQLFPNQQS
jgi:hypothetical protein